MATLARLSLKELATLRRSIEGEFLDIPHPQMGIHLRSL